MRRRLIAGFVGVSVVLVIALAVPLGVLFGRSLREKQVDELEDRASAIAVAFEQAVETGEVFDVRSSGELTTTILTPDAEFLTGAPVTPEHVTLARALIASGERSDTARAEGRATAAVLAGIDPEVTGIVIVTETTDSTEDAIHAGWLTLGALAAVVVAISVVIARSLASWIARPLTELRHASLAFGAADLSSRVEPEGWPSDLQALGVAFNSMAGRIEELVASNEAFVHEASHQLRTPLTSLRLRLDALADDVPTTSDELGAAREDVDRLSRLTDGLLTLARAERASAGAPVRLELRAFIDDRVEQWGPLADEYGISLIVSPGNDADVWADADRLDQVLDNLFANAFDASASGTTITCRIETGPEAVELAVVDQGRGMTTEERTRAFERFWSSPGEAVTNRAGLGGTGLGLPIAARLLDQDGATIRLEAGPGGVGTAAVIRFRRA